MNELDLFTSALALSDSAERAAFLDRECAGNPGLRRRLAELLSAHVLRGNPLDGVSDVAVADPRPADGTVTFGPGDPAPTAAYPGRDEHVGAVLAGKYKLVEAIGEGGMGAVYLAQQTEPVKRAVAVKVIKAGMDSKAVLARFEAERQALAMMDHPNIARVLDAGTTESGRPYFVMELVKGVPITRFCDERKLTPRQRLELFVPVCHAIQHAHQKGVIHRDIKPSNVLVALYDDKPVPKVIDFGIAKAAGSTLTDKTLMTGFGAVVGTPEYMSPEQASLNNLDVDTRSDVYSLGVLLYELLTGHTPVDRKSLGQAALLEVLRIVREVEAPRPSAKLSTIDTLPSVAANRGTEPAKLSKLMKGELDWVLLKALEKDRTRRYDTANGLARDIQRYLADEVVEARPPSTGYRLKKFVRRHKGQVVAASLVLFALVAGVVGTSLGLVEAKRQEEIARAEATEKERQRDIAEAKQGEAEKATLAEKAAKQKAIQNGQKALAALRAATSEDVEKLIGEKKEFTDNEREYIAAIAKRWQGFSEAEGDDAESREMRAEGHFQVGLLWAKLGRIEEAQPESEQAVIQHMKLADDFPTVPAYRRQLAMSHNLMGALLANQSKLAEAEGQYRKGLAIRMTLAAEFGTKPAYRQDLAAIHINLGNLLEGQNRPAEAEEQYRKGLAIQETLAAEFPTMPVNRRELGRTHNSLGNLLASQSRPAEAEGQFKMGLAVQEKLAAEFPTVSANRSELSMTHNNLGRLLADQNRPAEAEGQFKLGVAIQEKLAAEFRTVPAYRKALAMSHNNLGILLMSQNRPAEAEGQYRKALTIQETLAAEFRTVPLYRFESARTHNNLGILLAGQNNPAEAEGQYRKGLAIQEALAAEFRTVPAYRSELARTYISLGNLLASQNRPGEAEGQYRKGLATQVALAAEFRTVPAYRTELADSHNNLGNLLVGRNKLAEAEEQIKSGLAIQEALAAEFRTVPAYRFKLARSHNSLGNLLADQNRPGEAEGQYRKGLAIQEALAAEFRTVPAYQVDLGGSYSNIGNVVSDTGKPADSLEWYEKAINTLRPVHDKNPRDVTAKQFLRNSYHGRARAYEQLQKYAESMKDWDRAMELSEKQDQPRVRADRAITILNAGQVAEAVAEVTELRNRPEWNAGYLYDFAIVYVVASRKFMDKKTEYADAAMEMLAKSVAAGYKDAAHVKKDPHLDPLRDRDDFKKLVADLERRFPPPREATPVPAEKR